MRVLTRCLIVVCLCGCSFSAQTRQTQTNGVDTGNRPQWEKLDIKTIPYSDNAESVAYYADIHCRNDAGYEQRFFAFRLAFRAYSLKKENRKISMLLSKSAFLAAEMETDSAKIVELVKHGMESVENIYKKDPEAAYLYGINLGLHIQAKGLFAVSKLPAMIDALEIACKKPSIEMGGPLRALGILYLKAPSWPSGPGDTDLALELLEESVKKYPGHPQNHIFFAEALFDDGNRQKALTELVLAEKLSLPELWGTEYASRWKREIFDLKKKLK